MNLLYANNYCTCDCESKCSDCIKSKYADIYSFVDFITEENLKKFIQIVDESVISEMIKDITSKRFNKNHYYISKVIFDNINFLIMLINNISSDKLLNLILLNVDDDHTLSVINTYYTIKSKKETVSDITTAIKNSTDEIKTFTTTTYSANNYYDY